MIFKITEVKFIPISQQKSLIGFASCNINDVLLLESIGVHCRKDGKGFRLTYPARKLNGANGSGKLQFFFRMIDREGEKELLEAITQEIKNLGLYTFNIQDEKENQT